MHTLDGEPGARLADGKATVPFIPSGHTATIGTTRVYSLNKFERGQRWRNKYPLIRHSGQTIPSRTIGATTRPAKSTQISPTVASPLSTLCSTASEAPATAAGR